MDRFGLPFQLVADKLEAVPVGFLIGRFLAAGKTIIAIFAALGLVAATGWLVYHYGTFSLSQIPTSPEVPRKKGPAELRERPLREFKYSQLQMAMPMRITVWCDSEERAETVCKQAFDRASQLVKVFSDYDPTSESRQLAAGRVGESIAVSDPLLQVMVFSSILNHRSNGAFDPTASPAISLWRAARKSGELPNQTELKRTLRSTGFDNLQIDSEMKTVALLVDGMNFDFGGIAKGYIGDQVIEVLTENGIEIGCYQAGGDIVMSESPPETNGWLIDVGKGPSGVTRTLELKNCGVSTSGDSQQFVEIDGVRYSHVIDPRTGIGVTTGRTAFVIAPSGIQSDALATVGCVLREAEFQETLSHYRGTTGWTRQDKFEPVVISRDISTGLPFVETVDQN